MAAKIVPRILVIDEELPIPKNTGKRIRTWNLLVNLADQFRIDFLTHKNSVNSDVEKSMKDSGINVIFSDSFLQENKGIQFLFRLVINLVSPLPYSVQSHYQIMFQESLNQLLSQSKYDLVHCEWSPYAQYMLGSKTPWCISAHNIESQILFRTADTKRGISKWFFSLQARRMKNFEERVFPLAQQVFTVSSADADKAKLFGAERVDIIPNGVEINYFQSATNSGEHPHQLVFTGSMDWRPNQDGIIWFLDEVAPHLSPLKEWRLSVVGRNPPRWLEKACASSGIAKTTGSVEDVRPFMREAQIYIVPLRIGGGSRLKILEALSMRKPVVSTTIGAEGLDVKNRENILLADDPKKFAETIEMLATSPELRVKLGINGRALVEEHYSWDRIAALQGAVWNGIIESNLIISDN